MRCHFCGWENPSNRTSCEKCNQPLDFEGGNQHAHQCDSGSDNDATNRETNRRIPENENFQPKKTVREHNGLDQNLDTNKVVCPHCGYTLNVKSEYCPVCGKPVDKVSETISESSNLKKTVRPDLSARYHKEVKKNFKLSLLSNEGDLVKSMDFEGCNVVLNRANTDEDNVTITSQEQAVIKFENGKWNIQDHSELKSTFVQASRPVELKDGDLILLGDKIFRFDLDE